MSKIKKLKTLKINGTRIIWIFMSFLFPVITEILSLLIWESSWFIRCVFRGGLEQSK